jgi:hypothetical protein
MSDKTDQDYQQARAAFDARWQAAKHQPEPSEIRVIETVAEDALLDRMLARLRELALACAEQGLIDAARRDRIHAAVDEIRSGFAGVAREDLVAVMRSTTTQSSTTPPVRPPR